MPPGRNAHAMITATANDAYRRLFGHRASPEITTRARPNTSMVGRVPKVGINQNTGTNVPRMLPTVDSAYTRPAVLPPVATSVRRSRIANGLTQPSKVTGTANRSTTASSVPATRPTLSVRKPC